MATSGTYVFSVSRDDIIRQALLNIRKLDEVETPTPQETTDCARVLNMLVKQWQGRTDYAPGLKTWTRRRGYLFLNNNSGQYTLGTSGTGWTNNFVLTNTVATATTGATSITLAVATGVSVGDSIGVQLDSGALFWTTVLTVAGAVVGLTASLPSQSSSGAVVYDYTLTAQQPNVIESAILRDSNYDDIPLRIMRTTQEYDMLPSKADVNYISDPTAIYYEFQLQNSYLYTDVAAAYDVTKYIVLTYLEAIQDFNNPLDTPEYPQEWFLALCWGLAKNIAPMYGAVWSPAMQDAYKEATAIARNKGAEMSALFFEPGVDP